MTLLHPDILFQGIFAPVQTVFYKISKEKEQDHPAQ